MALPRTRQFSLFEEDPGFNLGMTPQAFENLGLLSLPGAGTTVANPAVVENIVAQANNQNNKAVGYGSELIGGDTTSTTARDLFDYYATGFNPDQAAIDFWNNKIATLGYENTLNEFLNPAQGSAAPRFSVMSQDPDYLKVAKPIPATPLGPDLKVVDDVVETVDPGWLGDNINISGEPEPQQKTTVPTVTGPEARTVTDTGQTQTQQTAVDTRNFPKFEGTPYDPAAYDKILKQLTAQSTALKTKFNMPYTSTFGGTEETVQDLAKRLAAMGLSDISELGMKHELPVEKVYETVPGDEGGSMTFDTGKYRTISGFKGYDAEANPIYEYRELTPEEVKKIQFDKTGFGFLPIGMKNREELMNLPIAETKYYNKKTGQEIDTRQFGGKAESGLFASSGAGEGYTNYRVMYDKDGNPVFIPEKQLSGMKDFVVNTLPGLLSVASIVPGAAPFVTAAQVAGGLAAGMDPGKLLESVGRSLIASNIGNLLPAGLQEIGLLDKPIWDDYLGKFIGGGPTTDLGKLALSAGSSGLSSLIRGGDLEDALKSAALSATGTGISSLLPKGQIGDFDYGQLLTALAPALADGKLSNADLFRLVNLYAKQEAKQGKTPGKP